MMINSILFARIAQNNLSLPHIPQNNFECGEEVFKESKVPIKYSDVSATFGCQWFTVMDSSTGSVIDRYRLCGEKALAEWMKRNVKFPTKFVKSGGERLVFVKFIVEKDGQISNVKIVKSGSKELDEEAVRLLKEMPHWIPGEKGGVKVRSKFTIPINFLVN